MNIKIALLGRDHGWETLLEQEGVPYGPVGSPDHLSPEEYSGLVLDNIPAVWVQPVVAYVRGGGAALITDEVHAAHFGGRRRRAGEPMEVLEFGAGTIAVVPFDPAKSVADPRRRSRQFNSPTYRPIERVSLISKGEVQRLVHTALEALHHRRGFPYCHLWYFPAAERNVFALRVDSDYADKHEIDSLYRFAEDRDVKMTWFLHTQAHEEWIGRFAQMRGHEIGLHCYEHAMLMSNEGSKTDLLRGRELLERHGLHPEGFAAPFGEWNPALGRVVEEMGFLYSSEFSYDYDNLPSFPWDGTRKNAVLQVPVHPISAGSFPQSEKDSAVVQYFRHVMEMKRALNEPLFFYHHPRDRHLAALEYLIDAAKEADIPTLLFRDFARWWKERLSSRYSVQLTAKRLITRGTVPASVSLHVTTAETEAFERPGPVDLEHAGWRSRTPGPSLPAATGSLLGSVRVLLEELRIRLRRKYK